ncbi:Lipase, secreted [Ceraceosorus bombacis]|uniref:triacylglycerol lipase n=1 Tax=Ceraceosorus bombacis TaxID=401625 RepID=A0A0P1BAG4_9BASI|nr:Lipase, secreted [Ceraceosorus bombacis]
MKFSTCGLALVAILTAAAFVDAVSIEPRLLGRLKYPQPSVDPFYKVPDNIGTYANGAIIRERDITSDLALGVDSQLFSKVYQLLYRSQTGSNQPDATVTTVFKPKNPKKGVPQIVAYAAFADSAAKDCASSYALIRDSGSQQGAVLVSQAPYINALLQKGYYVSVPDYQGSQAAFIVGPQEGRAHLDGLRALLNHKPTLSDSTGYQAVIAGYSGGGHAAAWAMQYRKEYASELNIIGGSYGGVPVNLTATLEILNKGLFAGFGPAGLAGAANAYPEVENYLLQQLKPNGTEAFKFLRSDQGCIAGELGYFAFKDYYSYVKSGAAALQDAIPVKYFEINRLGSRGAQDLLGPEIPVYIYHARNDEVIPRPPVDDYVKWQCANGARIEYSLSDLSEHATETLIGVPGAVDWINKVFEGRLKQPKCVQSQHSLLSLTSYGAEPILGTKAANQLRALLPTFTLRKLAGLK